MMLRELRTVLGIFAGVSITALSVKGVFADHGIILTILYCSIALFGISTAASLTILAATQSNSPLRDLDIQPGASMAIISAFASVCLQQHHPLVAYAVKLHSNFDSRPLQRIMRTVMFTEIAINGSVNEQEQLASWLRWIHVRVKGVLPPDLVSQTGLKLDANYGYVPDLMAYVLQTIIWSATSFQKRYGRQTSQIALDAMVTQYAMVGRQLGIHEDLMPMSYADFCVSFQKRLEAFPGFDDSLRPERIAKFEQGDVYATSSWFMRVLFHCAWVLAVRLLPEELQNSYKFSSARTIHGRLLYRVLDVALRVAYPIMPWLPLRGLLNLVCVMEPQMTAICVETLCSVRSMDLHTDRPMYKAANMPDQTSHEDVEAFFEWLRSYRPFTAATGSSDYTLLQCACIHAIEIQSSWAILRLARWVRSMVYDINASLRLKLRIMWRTRRCSQMRNIIAHSVEGRNRVIPSHVGCIMDGNRRWSRQRGLHSVHEGHTRGAGIARSILTWWAGLVQYCDAHDTPDAPRILTLWALSTDNMKRPHEEVDWLYSLLTSSIIGFRYSPLVHLFRVRVRIIGSAKAMSSFPPGLDTAITELHKATSSYGLAVGGMELQLAIGYGGQDETIDAIDRLQSQDQPITSAAISKETYTARNGLTPVDLILRTSERRTSGFFLWEGQGAEFFFVNKLWPEFNELDWLSAIHSFGQTEQRRGL